MLIWMNTQAVLAEIIQPGPDLLPFWAIHGGTTKAPVSAIPGHNFMNTLLVSIQVIVCTETIDLGTIGHVAFEWFFVPEDVLSGPLLLPGEGIR